MFQYHAIVRDQVPNGLYLITDDAFKKWVSHDPKLAQFNPETFFKLYGRAPRERNQWAIGNFLFDVAPTNLPERIRTELSSDPVLANEVNYHPEGVRIHGGRFDDNLACLHYTKYAMKLMRVLNITEGTLPENIESFEQNMEKLELLITQDQVINFLFAPM